MQITKWNIGLAQKEGEQDQDGLYTLYSIHHTHSITQALYCHRGVRLGYTISISCRVDGRLSIRMQNGNCVLIATI